VFYVSREILSKKAYYKKYLEVLGKTTTFLGLDRLSYH